jgi:HAD superfamily phosphoserine phosphatase-like hydrolase
MKIALFDVCGTLYNSNTTYDFHEFFWKTRNPRKYLFIKFMRGFPTRYAFYLLRKLFKLHTLRDTLAHWLKGVALDEVQQASADFIRLDLEGKQRTDIIQMLEHYRNQGYHLLLMSGSYTFIVAEIARRFQVDHFVASELATDHGVFTGTYAQDILHQKKEVFVSLYPEVSDLVVVTDNRTDLALLQMAAQGYAVAATPKNATFWNNQQLSHIQLIEV